MKLSGEGSFSSGNNKSSVTNPLKLINVKMATFLENMVDDRLKKAVLSLDSEVVTSILANEVIELDKIITALRISMENNSDDITEILINKSQLLIEPNKKVFRGENSSGVTSLYYAVELGSVVAIKCLLYIEKIDPNDIDQFGQNSLYRAVGNNAIGIPKQIQIIEALLEHPLSDPKTKCRDGGSAIDLAKHLLRVAKNTVNTTNIERYETILKMLETDCVQMDVKKQSCIIS